MNVGEDVNVEAYRQAFETYRHYANLRFAALTAFIAITGGLFVVALKRPSDDQAKSSNHKVGADVRFYFLCVVGVLVACNFLFYDIRLDQLMAFFVTNAYGLAKVLNMDAIAKTMPPPTRASYLAYPDTTQTAYCGAIVAWIVAAFLKWRKKL